jgi:alpha-beta hydrolase superfamily lysophospholipase
MIRLTRTLAALLALSAALMHPAVAAADGGVPCDAQCQWQWTLQRQNALPRTDFYDPPNPLRWEPAGTLIRQQATADYAVGPATRILYHSRTSAGRDVAGSAVIVVPPGSPPAGGWPVVVDAHGASGVGRDCAPSLMRDLYHGDQMMRFVAQGYAVVAADYAGLGTDGRHALGDKTAAASDVVNALRAAHQTGMPLSHSWVLWGHSQGGGAALAVAERQRLTPEPGYLGAVVTSPIADLTAVADHLVNQPGYGAIAALLAVGAKASDPGLRLDRVLTPEALTRLSVTGTGCLGVTVAVYADLTGDTLVQPGYLTDSHFGRYLTANTTGRLPAAGPLLLLQGTADPVTPQALTDNTATSLCAAGTRLDYRTYPGLAHDTYPGVVVGIDDGAMPDILVWTADRFAGKPARSTCPAPLHD